MNNAILELLQKRMYLKDGEKSWSDICNRVAKSLSSVEETDDLKDKVYNEIFVAMNNKSFIFGSPVLLNANESNDGQLSSCFCLGIEDNIESITKANAKMIKIFQKNGGVGFDLSVLRPSNSAVEKSNGYSCGVLGFAEMFNTSTDVMTRNNMSKRGALKINLGCWHPDIFDFVHCKDDTSKLNFMNISVSFTNDFMDALKRDDFWNLIFPDYTQNKELYNREWNGNIKTWLGKGYPVKIYKTVKAKDLWDEFIKSSWATGEPALNFQDIMNDANKNKHLCDNVLTNPCFSGDMEILTADGYKTFEELDGKEVEIINVDGNKSLSTIWCSGEKEIIEIIIDGGHKIKCTSDHIFKLYNGEECQAKDLLHKYIIFYKENIGLQVIGITHKKEICKVYDFTEPLTHWGVVNGFVVHNCGEFINIPEASCNLGSFNLSNFVKENAWNEYEFDWKELETLAYKCVRWFDNMIEVNSLPIKSISKITKGIRAIGIGSMGLADTLYKLKIPYNSQEGRDFAKKIMGVIYNKAFEASRDLAEIRGTYKYWKGSEWEKQNIEIRNSNLISAAPTGSISLFAECSSGIEPVFALVYNRRTSTGEDFEIINPVFKRALEDEGIECDEKLIKTIIENGGSCQGLDIIPNHMQKVFVIASDISPKDHVEMLSSISEHVDMAVSKSINFSNNATPEYISDVYKYAYEKKIKGLTVYRDGSRENQTLYIKKDNKKENVQQDDKLGRGDILCVNDDLLGIKRTIVNGCGKFYLETWFDEHDGEMFETFISMGSEGGCERNIQFISRLISIALRAGISPEVLIDQARSIKPCKAYTDRCRIKGDTYKGTSCPSAIGNALEEATSKIQNRCFDDYDDNETTENKNFITTNKCPECETGILQNESGCVLCHNCGYSRCG